MDCESPSMSAPWNDMVQSAILWIAQHTVDLYRERCQFPLLLCVLFTIIRTSFQMLPSDCGKFWVHEIVLANQLNLHQTIIKNWIPKVVDVGSSCHRRRFTPVNMINWIAHCDVCQRVCPLPEVVLRRKVVHWYGRTSDTGYSQRREAAGFEVSCHTVLYENDKIIYCLRYIHLNFNLFPFRVLNSTPLPRPEWMKQWTALPDTSRYCTLGFAKSQL